MGFTPTSEQQDALTKFGSGSSMVIEAGAGTGKTATLDLISRSTGAKGRYIAFNKAIVVEASERFPGNVSCSTVHSLAYRPVGSQFRARMNSKRQRAEDVARFLSIDPFVIDYGGKPKRLAPGFLAGHVRRAITRFCQSTDETPTVKHFPYIDGLDIPDASGKRSYAWNDKLADELLPALLRAWADLQKRDGEGGFLRFGHEHYLKIWQLGHPRLDGDFILLDEAQDANPVMAAVFMEQTQMQRIAVGDSQQAIYEFTGAVNALAQLETDVRTFLTQSFRFGPAVAGVANLVLAMISDAELRLIGSPHLSSTVEALDHPAAYLTRTNGRALREVLDTLSAGRKVHLVGGGKEIVAFAEGAASLMAGRHTTHPELAAFSSWSEVQTYVEHDEDGSDLRMLVKIVDEYGVDVILDGLGRQSSERDADLIVSTAHKAKGREWSTVKIGDDFVREEKQPNGTMAPKPLETPELRLLYVAVTRAREVLDDTDVRKIYEPKTPKVATPVS